MAMQEKTNRYTGRCHLCGGEVQPMAGVLHKTDMGDWRVQHKQGACKAPEQPTKVIEPTDEALDNATQRVIELMALRFTELLPALVEENLILLSRVAEIKVGDMPTVKIDVAHTMLPTIVTAVVAGASPFLVGPAGSGKTTLGQQVAKVLNRPFYMAARVTSEYKLTGFIDAHGNVVRSAFRDAYEKGGVFLFDEVDASDADALTTFNAALANGVADFPDGMVERHEDFVAIAAGNTFGRGADRQYVGRNQLDAATLDRLQVFEVDYDEQLERDISGNLDWARHVQSLRAAAEKEKVRHIISPRASVMGAKLLAQGMDLDTVMDAVVWKGLAAPERSRIVGSAGSLYNAD